MVRKLYEACNYCGGYKSSLFTAVDDSDFDDLMRELTDEVYKSKNQKYYSPELVQLTADKLLEAISEGYGNIEVDWNTPDHLMLEKLVENVFSFSSAKNYQQLHDITQNLMDEKGQLRGLNDFRRTVEEIGYKYNRDWLDTEYNTAVASATSSARWSEFVQEADTLPYLQYQTVGDGMVRPAHQLLDGVTKHIKDEFWDTYYPPNGWNCRCEAIQLPDSDAQETNTPAYLPQVQTMFKTNLAKSGLLFPKDHPYYEGVPKDMLRRSMQYIPKDYAFRTKKGYEEHAMIQHEDEADVNRHIAKLLAENGETKIKLMPRLHEKETELREKIYGRAYSERHPTKCPDAWINNEPVEFKECKRTNMSKRVLEASKQADTAIIMSKEILTDDYIKRFISGQWKQADRKNLKQIIIINNEKVTKYDRP